MSIKHLFLLFCAPFLLLGKSVAQTGSEEQISFSTDVAIGASLMTYFIAYEGANLTADGIKGGTVTTGEADYATVEKQNITIRGKMRVVGLGNNELTKVDLSQAPSIVKLDLSANKLTSVLLPANSLLDQIDISMNNLDAVAMEALFNSLPKRSSEQQGSIIIGRIGKDVQESNTLSSKLLSIGISKGWKVSLFDEDEGEIIPYEAKESAPTIKFTTLFGKGAELSMKVKGEELPTIKGGAIRSNLYNKETGYNEFSFQISDSSFELSGNIDTLDCSSALLTEIDASGCPILEMLDCSANRLSKLDFSKNKELISLNCGVNDNLSSIQFAPDNKLKELTCHMTALSSVPTKELPELRLLMCFNNRAISKLDLSNNHKLTDIFATGCSLTEIPFSQVPFLEILDCSNNKLTQLDLSSASKIKYVDCSFNRLTSINGLNKCPVLETLICAGNELKEIDLRSNPKLLGIACFNNKFTSIDFSQNPALNKVLCSNNNIRGEKMEQMLLSLPKRDAQDRAQLVVVDLNKEVQEQNICTKEDVAIATNKGWEVYATDSESGENSPYEGSVAIQTIAPNVQITLYPNPTSEKIYLLGTTAGQKALLFNLRGECLQKQTLSGDNDSIDVSPLGSGVYYLQIGGASYPVIVR